MRKQHTTTKVARARAARTTARAHRPAPGAHLLRKLDGYQIEYQALDDGWHARTILADGTASDWGKAPPPPPGARPLTEAAQRKLEAEIVPSPGPAQGPGMAGT